MGDKTMVRAVVVSALAVLLTACTSGEARDAEPTTSDSTTSTTGQPPAAASGSAYVALGDSFTAGPGLAQPQQDAGYCQRSELNWPSLLAKSLKVAASPTSAVRGPRLQTRQPPLTPPRSSAQRRNSSRSASAATTAACSHH
ncbi:hypothetical protein [Aeromicrobium sp. UC242_57]|uniref:hypothetical protein n=1 Tax=Aeromicrobium sp. UC242_57 TaxID=3374624 RepID=UPI0037B6267C